jgi:hypothetical protein
MKAVHRLVMVALMAAVAVTSGHAQPAMPKMATTIPPEITTSNAVDTPIGTLRFFDGYPDEETIKKVYDNLDFLRGVEVFLTAMPAASMVGFRHGFGEVGAVDGTIGIFETPMDSKSLFLTPNTETVYALTWLDLKHGPVVVESPPNILGVMDDFWFRYVTDLGNV